MEATTPLERQRARALAEEYRSRGYEVIDMQPIFRDHYKKYGKRFEFPTDGHWNALGHGVVFEAITDSSFFAKFIGRAAFGRRKNTG